MTVDAPETAMATPETAMDRSPAAVAAAPTPHRAWLPYLDGWRGFSVLAVLVGHFIEPPVINAGRLGVEMFFCLSGRLMAGILFVETYPLRAFILRRISRVWPALYVFIILCSLAFAGAGVNHIGLIDVVAAMTFTANYAAIYVERAPVFDHLWSLAVEEWAYLLLAVVAMGCRRMRWSPLPLLCVGAVLCMANGLVRTLYGLDYYAVYWRTDVRIASILVSCAIYLMMRERRVHPLLPLVVGVAGLVLNTNHVPDPVKYSLGTTALAFSLATIDATIQPVLALMSGRWIRQIGLWSFSLYLWQQPLAKIEGHNVVIRLVAVFGFALVSFYAVEQPTRRWLNRRFAD